MLPRGAPDSDPAVVKLFRSSRIGVRRSGSWKCCPADPSADFRAPSSQVLFPSAKSSSGLPFKQDL